MRFKRTPLPLAVQMDMAPLIDIVFQQLIFFMLTSAFVFQPGVKVHLPKSVTPDVAYRENRVVSVAKGNQLYLGNRLVTLQELRSELAALRDSKRPFLIRADRQASVGRVVEVWDLCRSLGVTQVNIATSSPQAQEGQGASGT
ncbi:MAG: biopolymer transporter ExbD [Candidatus Omnitrophica bacterium]|nr:biopolymer transporter ExbD [Candidatus Omnitrophota bacterium]